MRAAVSCATPARALLKSQASALPAAYTTSFSRGVKPRPLFQRQGALRSYPSLPGWQRVASGRAAGRQVVTMAGDARGTIKDKTVVITGAGRGIGLEFVKQFLERGNRVIATVRTESAAATLEELGENVTVALMDVTDTASIDRFAQTVQDQTEHVDVVINNAGILIYSDLDSVSADDMMRSFQVNTVGPLLVTQALVRQGVIANGERCIVGNVTSKVGSNTDNGSGGGYAYRASKAALNIVTTSLSVDLKERGVASVMLHPGWVRTDMTGGGGLIDADESAGGLIGVLESDLPLNGKWWDYKSEAIPF